MKRSLVFIHGFASNKHAMDCIIPLCNQLNIDYYSFDLPLHGEFNEEEYVKEFDFDDLVYFAKSYVNSLGINNIILVGHSMGAAIILNSYQEIDNVKQIILIDPLNKHIGASGMDQFKELFASPNLKPNIQAQEMYIKRILKSGLKNSKNLIKIILSFSTKNFMNKFNSIKLDKELDWSLIYGKDDVIINGIKTEKWLKELNSDIKTFIINDAGHNPFKSNEKEFLLIMKKLLTTKH